MKNIWNGIALVVVMTAGAFGVAAVVVARHDSTPRPDLSRPIPRAEAEALLQETVRLAQSGDVHGICKNLAAVENMCEHLLITQHEPGKLAPTVVDFEHHTGGNSPTTAVLHLLGLRDDGTTYTSDFSVIRVEPDRLAAFTAIYWSGVKYGRQAPNSSTTSPPPR
ncbi:hypothetical protein [Amycolatopsis sp.]|uniref:hypothetical protein n=1 Tax=Amycolatopsis sp. TaxID=37632 RepID=UPI002DFE1ACB|nr:hypothetical protein [Amycolatopsis sp.]